MAQVKPMGIVHKLSNCSLTRVDVQSDHYYFINDKFCISVTKILDLAAPFPEGLRQWQKNTDPHEQESHMLMTRDRGSKLHRALEELFLGWELTLADYPTEYERQAIISFIRCIRFLCPEGITKDNFRTELVVGDPKRRIAGTLDLWIQCDSRRLDMLLEPVKYLDMYADGLGVKPKFQSYLEGKPDMVSVIIDYKFTGRSTYNHMLQVAAYKHLFNVSYINKLPYATRAFTWRYSGIHKNKFDMKESIYDYQSFTRVYDTCMEYLGSFPEPPEINVYPDTVRLFEEEVIKEVA